MESMNPDLARAEQAPDFGVRLTQAEYERRVRSLYAGGPAIPTEEQATKRAQIELHLLIDYHLGMDFPKSRREQLWKVKRKLDARRLWLLVRGFLSSPTDPGTGMMRSYVRAFSRVLSTKELRAFLDLSADDLARLK